MHSAVIGVFCRPVPTSFVAQIKHFKACEVCFFDCASVPEVVVYLVPTLMSCTRTLRISLGTRCKIDHPGRMLGGLFPCT